MSALDLVREAHVHREVYCAILNSALRTPGSKRQLAACVNISPAHLSYVLHPDSTAVYAARSASRALEHRLAEALPLPPEQRLSLLEHMALARDSETSATQALRAELLERPLNDLLHDVRQAHQEATYAQEPHSAKVGYMSVRDLGAALLRHAVVYTFPVDAVEICMLVHDAQCVLNRADDALYWAKLAHEMLSSSAGSACRDSERRDRLSIQALRAQAVAFNNLYLFKEADACCDRVKASDAFKRQPDAIRPHLYRDKIGYPESPVDPQFR